MRTFTTSLLATVALTFVAAASATAQPRVTIADYERAERFMTYNTTPLVSNGAVRANWLPDDRFWYRNQYRDRQRIHPGRCGPRHEGAGLRPCRGGGGPDHCAGADDQRVALAVPANHVRRHPPALFVRQRRQAVDVRRAGQAMRQRRSPRHAAQQRGVARRQARGVHSRLQPVGARPRGRHRQAADDGRREGLRLCHRQRRMDPQRSAGGVVVARLEEDGDLPAGRARRRRDVPGEHDGGTSDAPGVEVPAAGRRGDHHHPARDRRSRGPEGHPPADAGRPAPLDDVRRRQVRRRVGRRAVEAGRQRGRVRVELAQPPGSRRCGSPTRRPAGSATSSTKRPRPSSNPATARSIGATSRNRTRRSGFRRKTTGAISICTISRPGS